MRRRIGTDIILQQIGDAIARGERPTLNSLVEQILIYAGESSEDSRLLIEALVSFLISREEIAINGKEEISLISLAKKTNCFI